MAPDQLNVDESGLLRVPITIDMHVFFLDAFKFLVVRGELVLLAYVRRIKAVFTTIQSKLTPRALVARYSISVEKYATIAVLAPLVGDEGKFTDRFVKDDFLVIIIGCQTDCYV